MPIRPENRARYPKDWKLISSYIRQVRALGKCEWCGVKNGAIGARDKHGEWHDEDRIHHLNSGVGFELFGQFPNMIKIVLTVAHIHDPAPEVRGDRNSNLAALCQKCHLNHDREHHVRMRKVNRDYARGQDNLFEL